MSLEPKARVPAIAPDRARPSYMAHIVLRTRDKARLRDWYEVALGAELVFENARIAFLTFDREHHRLAFIEDPQAVAAPENGIGLVHFAYSYGSLDGLIETYERLKAVGARPRRVINHGTTTSLYYADPDGNVVEMQVDNFPDPDTLNAWYAEGQFDENPIGIEFDFEELVRRRHAGAEAADLLAPWTRNGMTG